jgi:hypothetical protein
VACLDTGTTKGAFVMLDPVSEFLRPLGRESRLRVYDAVIEAAARPLSSQETASLLSGISWHLRHDSEAEALENLLSAWAK